MTDIEQRLREELKAAASSAQPYMQVGRASCRERV